MIWAADAEYQATHQLTFTGRDLQRPSAGLNLGDCLAHALAASSYRVGRTVLASATHDARDPPPRTSHLSQVNLVSPHFTWHARQVKCISAR